MGEETQPPKLTKNRLVEKFRCLHFFQKSEPILDFRRNDLVKNKKTSFLGIILDNVDNKRFEKSAHEI